MTPSTLSKNQAVFLSAFASSPLADQFYLTGGTALTEFYIPYRLSEDLDFFSEQEIDVQLVTTFLKSVRQEIGYKQIDLNTSFNRNIIHLIFGGKTLKLEFTYFPFPQIEAPLKKKGLLIDSIDDIAVNKLFTIYQNPRSRDFMDLYMIHKKYKFELESLITKAKAKFDWHVDPIKLGVQFLLVEKIKDYPKLITPLSEKLWQDFFRQEAKKLKKNIFI